MKVGVGVWFSALSSTHNTHNTQHTIANTYTKHQLSSLPPSLPHPHATPNTTTTTRQKRRAWRRGRRAGRWGCGTRCWPAACGSPARRCVRRACIFPNVLCICMSYGVAFVGGSVVLPTSHDPSSPPHLSINQPNPHTGPLPRHGRRLGLAGLGQDRRFAGPRDGGQRQGEWGEMNYREGERGWSLFASSPLTHKPQPPLPHPLTPTIIIPSPPHPHPSLSLSSSSSTTTGGPALLLRHDGLLRAVRPLAVRPQPPPGPGGAGRDAPALGGLL